MRAFIATFTFFLGNSLLGGGLSYAYDKQALMESYFSVVMIRGYNQSGGIAYGSGVVVSKNKVITNCHVLRSTKQPWVARGQDSYEITSVKADTWHDLCLASTVNLPIKPVRIGNSGALKRGQEVAGIGHSSGSPAPLTSTGYVNGLYPEKSGNVIRTNAKFLMGASGSGLFNMDGYLVGINTFKTAGKGGSIHFALPVEWLSTLERLPETSLFPISGKALWEEDEDKKPYYMQAAVPESRYEWATLGQVATKWIKAEPKNPDAWFALGVSQENLGKVSLATEHYLKSSSLDQGNLNVLIKIGDLAKKRGDHAEVKRVHVAISKIDQDIGMQYQTFVDCIASC